MRGSSRGNIGVVLIGQVEPLKRGVLTTKKEGVVLGTKGEGEDVPRFCLTVRVDDVEGGEFLGTPYLGNESSQCFWERYEDVIRKRTLTVLSPKV